MNETEGLMMAVRLRNGLSIPCVGSNGVMIDMEMIRSVHSRLVALQKEEGSLEALNLLYGMCRQLVVQKGINEDAVLIQDGTAKELLKKHRIIVGQEIEPKLSIVYNCLMKDRVANQIKVVCPIDHDCDG